MALFEAAIIINNKESYKECEVSHYVMGTVAECSTVIVITQVGLHCSFIHALS